MTDIEITKQFKMLNIYEICKKLNISDYDTYGKYKAKINSVNSEKEGNIVLVTAINTTPYGEGKTTVAIGIHDSLCKLGKSSIAVLREPSMGPVFGIKGGATGGGYSQVVPMEDINLHFTGDFHAITSANNLISACIDNSIYFGNPLKLKMAEEFAHADEIIDLNRYPNPEKIFKEFTEEKKGLDVAVECVGLPEIWERIFSCVRPGGTVHFFGGCKSGSTVTFDTTRMHYGDIKLMSVFHHTPQYFRQALDYIASGEVEVEKLFTNTLALKDVEFAMKQHIEGKAIKFLIKP